MWVRGSTGGDAPEESGPGKSEKILKKSAKKFGGNQKVRIFAVPFGKRGTDEAREGFRKGRRRRSLTRLKASTRSNKVPKNKINESVNSERNRSPDQRREI